MTMQTRLQTLRDVSLLLRQLYAPTIPSFASTSACVALKGGSLGPCVTEVKRRLETLDAFTKEEINGVLMQEGEKWKSDRRRVMNALRIALTGSNKGFVGVDGWWDLGTERDDGADRERRLRAADRGVGEVAGVSFV